MSRVLLHSLVFAPDRVSTAYLMTDLAIELKRLGHTVTVLTTTPHYNIDPEALPRQPMRKRWAGLLFSSENAGIPVWHVKVPLKGKRVWLRVLDYLRFHLLSLVAAIRKVGPQDIVMAVSPPLTLGVMSWLLGKRWRVPSIYIVQELYPDLVIRQGVVHGAAMIRALRRLEHFVYAHNAAVVTIDEQFSAIVQERGVPEQKLFTIPNFVDTDLYQPLPRRNPFSVEHGLLEDFVVLYGGNIGIVQDWEAVLFAAECSRGMPIQFVIVGDGARRDWVAEQVQQRNLNNVKLLGYQPKERMPEINASCDIGTIPMTQAGAQHGFPCKIYTHLACAKPVIVSADADSGMARLIEQSGCGRVVPPEDRKAYADAVLRAFQERDTLPAEGERGRRFVETDYSKQAIARKYDALIRKLSKK